MNNYKLAKVYDQKGDLTKRWFVGYYFKHPENGKMVLFKAWLSTRFKTKAALYRKARELTENINNKLLNGYNPFQHENISFTCLIEALEKIVSLKKQYTRHRTALTYKCYLNNFIIWLKSANLTKITVESFNYQYAQQFADYLLTEKKVTNRTYNNYVEHFSTLFNELVKREYLLRNPFTKIKKLPEGDRRIFAYTNQELELLKNHFPKNNPELWLVIQLIFYCAIRPNEIVQLKIKHFDLVTKTILVPGYISKTRQTNTIRMPIPFYEYLITLDLKKYPDEFYLISKDLRPGEIKIWPTRIAEQFREECNKIGLDRKLYELKHTGAGLSIKNGANIRDVQLHLRHTNINTTEIYLRAFQGSTSNEFIQNFPEL